MNELYFRTKTLYEKQGGAYPDPVTKLTWDYGPKDASGNVTVVDTHLIAKEINGYFLEDKQIKDTIYKKGTLVPSFAFRRMMVQLPLETGSTATPIQKRAI